MSNAGDDCVVHTPGLWYQVSHTDSAALHFFDGSLGGVLSDRMLRRLNCNGVEWAKEGGMEGVSAELLISVLVRNLYKARWSL